VGAFRTAKEVMPLLRKALDRYDIGLRDPKTNKILKPNDPGYHFIDPEEKANDIANWVTHDYGRGIFEDQQDLMQDVLGAADIFMEEGTIDDVLDGFENGKLDGFIQQLQETYAPQYGKPGSESYNEAVDTINNMARDALTYYRDNWLGYYADQIMDYTDYDSILNNRPIIQK